MINHTVTIRRHLAGNEARSYIAVVNILEEPDTVLLTSSLSDLIDMSESCSLSNFEMSSMSFLLSTMLSSQDF